jgi:hypothetical protein
VLAAPSDTSAKTSWSRGRARTRRDADRLKRIMIEMLDEALGNIDEKK